MKAIEEEVKNHAFFEGRGFYRLHSFIFLLITYQCKRVNIWLSKSSRVKATVTELILASVCVICS